MSTSNEKRPGQERLGIALLILHQQITRNINLPQGCRETIRDMGHAIRFA